MKHIPRSKRTGALCALLATTAVAGVLAFTRPTTHEQVDCPDPARRDRIVLVQVSSSERSEEIQQARLRLVRAKLAEAGVCGGSIVVQAWTGSGAIRTLWGLGDHLDVRGGTERARANRIGPAVDTAMNDTVVPKFRQALADLPADQSDFLAWRMLATDAIVQLGDTGGQPIEVTVASDGVHVDDQVNLNQPLSPEAVDALAKSVRPQGDLQSAQVMLVGIGQVAGDPPPAGGSWVEAVRRFAKQTCDATGAKCTVVSSSIDQAVG